MPASNSARRVPSVSLGNSASGKAHVAPSASAFPISSSCLRRRDSERESIAPAFPLGSLRSGPVAADACVRFSSRRLVSDRSAVTFGIQQHINSFAELTGVVLEIVQNRQQSPRQSLQSVPGNTGSIVPVVFGNCRAVV